MATETIKATRRESLGTRASRDLRAEGKVPAVLYGHGQDNVNLTIAADQVMTAIRHRAHVVELEGDVSETALLKDVQWGPFGAEVLHVDLTRVSKGEKAETTIAIELHGDAAGTREGGHVDHVTKEIQILCPISKIPPQFDINVTAMNVGDSITAGDIELPDGAELIVPADTTIVQVVERTAEPEIDDEAVEGGPVEPEVIGEKEADGEDD